MPYSKTELILQALKTAIDGIPELGDRIWRNRHEAFSRAGTFPAACVIEPIVNQPEAFKAGLDTMTHRLNMMYVVLINNRNSVTAADSVLVQIHTRVMADMNLGGLAQAIEPGRTTWDFEDDGMAQIQSHYTVLYRTKFNNLAAT